MFDNHRKSLILQHWLNGERQLWMNFIDSMDKDNHGWTSLNYLWLQIRSTRCCQTEKKWEVSHWKVVKSKQITLKCQNSSSENMLTNETDFRGHDIPFVPLLSLRQLCVISSPRQFSSFQTGTSFVVLLCVTRCQDDHCGKWWNAFRGKSSIDRLFP